jgi:hypothetical protein
MRKLLTAGLPAVAALFVTVAVAGATTPPSATFSQCPAVGADTSCALLIYIDSTGTPGVLGDQTQGPFDAIEDTLIGVQNDSRLSISTLPLSATTGKDLFGFDGDGLCTFISCTWDAPSGYEGPGVSFSDISSDTTSGTVNFSPAIPPGGHAYFSLEEALATVPPFDIKPGPPNVGVDSDGDGLPDAWEDSPGRDLGGGVFDNNLHQAGASSQHKDLFIEIAAEKGAGLSDKAKAMLIQAFAQAPVSNPDGTLGITLHIINGPTLSSAQSDSFRGTDGYPDGSKIYDFFKSDLEFHAYHYVVSTLWNTGKYAGISDNIPGQFVVLDNCGGRTQAAWFGLAQVARKACEASDTDQAANLMHELGHNLGLHHGGAAPLTGHDLEDPYKPNYLSVMGYSFSHGGIPGIGIDFSRWGAGDVKVLDENSLAEMDGVYSANASNPIPSGTKTFFYCPSDGSTRKVAVGSPADWTCFQGPEAGRVSANIDQPKSERTSSSGFPWLSDKILLSPHDDWASLQFNGGLIGQANGVYTGGIPIANFRSEPEPPVALRNTLAAQIDPVPATPQPVIVARGSASVTVQVPAVSETAATISWAPVLSDGSTGDLHQVTSISPGESRVVRFAISRADIAGAIGIACTLMNQDWVAAGAVKVS